MTGAEQKRVFISWAPFDTRSDSLAFHLGANCYHIHFFKLNRYRYLYAPLKYILAACKTLSVLQKEHPDVIFVMNPPIFAVFVIWLYCLLHKSKYIVDTHSATFTARRWAFFLWLYCFLSKRALTNILHNEPLRRKVSSWGAPTITLEDGPPQLKTDRTYQFRQGFNAVFVSTYGSDEPIYEVIDAARYLPTVNFYITGPLSSAPKQLSSNIPDNVVLTDFLPLVDYAALLKGCDVVICLTMKDNTMQCGAHEAIELGRPIITSDWLVLREFFSRGTIHIDNTSSSLIEAIEKMRMNYSYYLKEINILCEERRASWQERFSKLLELLNKNDTHKDDIL